MHQNLIEACKITSHMVLRRAEELRFRMESAEALRILKGRMRYSELSPQLGLPPTVLSRYVNGLVVPSLEVARRIMALFRSELSREVESRIRRDDVGGVDVTDITHDPSLLRHVVESQREWFSGLKVDYVMTMESDGIPVAYQFAEALGTRMAVVRKSKKLGIRDFVEARQVFESGAYRYIYLPRKAARRGDYALLVDDVIRTGATVKAMAMLCGAVRSNVAGVFSVVGFRQALDRLREDLRVPVASFITLDR